jgi:hypothetical protein
MVEGEGWAAAGWVSGSGSGIGGRREGRGRLLDSAYVGMRSVAICV